MRQKNVPASIRRVMDERLEITAVVREGFRRAQRDIAMGYEVRLAGAISSGAGMGSVDQGASQIAREVRGWETIEAQERLVEKSHKRFQRWHAARRTSGRLLWLIVWNLGTGCGAYSGLWLEHRLRQQHSASGGWTTVGGDGPHMTRGGLSDCISGVGEV